MRQMSVNQFRSHLKSAVDDVVEDHDPLKVTRRGSDDFVVISAEDWDREQETLYVLQNPSLMEQIRRSMETHHRGEGRPMTAEQLDEIDRS